MKTNKVFPLTIVLVLLVLMIFQTTIITENHHSFKSKSERILNKSLVDIDNINIDSDDDFISYGFEGNGTETEPYLIENYNINSPYRFGIWIRYTTKYFVIQNCFITSTSLGIEILDVEANTAKIIGNTISGEISGLVVYISESTLIANNSFENKNGGIWIEGSANSVIANNTFMEFGIRVWFDEWDSLSDCLSYDIYNNYIKGKPIGWIKNTNDLLFTTSDYEQLFFINCDNIEIRNQKPSDVTASFIGIGLYYCQNANITENECGVETVYGGNIKIANNVFVDTYIRTVSTTSVRIENNSKGNGFFHILLSNLNFAQIKNNTCGFRDHYAGISLYNCYSCSLIDNVITNNKECGVSLYYSELILIENNKIYNNEEYGIKFRETSDCQISHNIFYNNKLYGVNLIENSENNRFFFNIFTLNGNLDSSQAKDDGISNYWISSSTNKGNYWDDWSKSGTYAIDGSAGSYDTNPLSDTDYDGMPAEWEVEYELDPWYDDSADDLDNDDLTNLEEYIHNTNPRLNDTDDDNLLDGEEVLIYFTNPNNNDTDSDGYPDGYEIENGYDPLDPDSPSVEKTIFKFFNIIIATMAISALLLFVKRKCEKNK